MPSGATFNLPQRRSGRRRAGPVRGGARVFSQDLVLVVLDDPSGLWVAQRALSRQMTVTSPVPPPTPPQASSGID